MFLLPAILPPASPPVAVSSTYSETTRAARPPVETGIVFRPAPERSYAHHPAIAYFRGRFYAMFSQGVRDEDAPGQRVMLATSPDGLDWSEPAPLMEPAPESRSGRREGYEVLTAGGFYAGSEGLVAYVGEYDDNHRHTTLYALTTGDGETWSPPRDLGLPVVPNHPPRPVALPGLAPRLLMAGNFTFPVTEDLSGLTGWRETTFSNRPHLLEDNSSTFAATSRALGLSAALCEGASLVGRDGTVRMMLRGTGPGWRGHLWESDSRDGGDTWGRPFPIDFPDNDAKFEFGELPDGQSYYVGDPDPARRNARLPLILSLSRDGLAFDRHFVLGDAPYRILYPGRAKRGAYGYPSCLVHDGALYTIVSRGKEAIEVLKVRLADLGPAGS